MKDLDTFVASYRPDAAAIELIQSLKIALLAGISGAGKDTIKSRLIATNRYHRIVTHTSRQPRINRGVTEEDGINYHFTPQDKMVRMLENHEFIEANKYGQNLYATSIAEFKKTRDEGKIAIADIDVNGVSAFKAMAPQAVRAIFLTPPSYAVWFERWKARYGETYADHLDELESRRQTAIAELRHVLETPYYFYVINDDLETAVAQVDAIAQTGVQDEMQKIKARAAVEEILAEMKQAQF